MSVSPPSQPPPGQHPPAWHPDPLGRFDHRWWDGNVWTDQVSRSGQQQVDPLGTTAGAVPTTGHTPDRIQRQVQSQAGVAPGSVPMGGGTLFTEPILVVNQKAKLIELNNEFAIYDQHGTQMGAVRQVGQSMAKKALRLLTDVDQFLTHRLEVVDMAGVTQLRITRPAKLMKSRVIVEDASGREVGALVQQNVFGKIRFDITSGGRSVGSLNAQNWRAWDFHLQDAAGVDVATVKKTWEGLARTMFTTADNYVVKMVAPCEEPLRTLVVAAALSIDTALKQDSRGFN